MEKALEAYLGKVEKHLRPLSAPERADIVKEIQSEMEELLAEGKTAEDVTARLGKPDELAKAYLSDLITKNPSFSWKRVLALCAYYSVAGLSGLFVIPVLLVCAPSFMLCGIAAPVLGAVKMVDTLLHLGIPGVQYIGIAGVGNPVLVFALCIVFGAVLFLAGYACWRLLVGYVKGGSRVGTGLSQ